MEQQSFADILKQRVYIRAKLSFINEAAHSAFDYWSNRQLGLQDNTQSDSEEDDIDIVANGGLSVSDASASDLEKTVNNSWVNLQYWKKQLEADRIKQDVAYTTCFVTVNGIDYEYNPYFSRFQTDIDCDCDYCNTIIYCDDSFWPIVDMKISYRIYPMALLLVKK